MSFDKSLRRRSPGCDHQCSIATVDQMAASPSAHSRDFHSERSRPSRSNRAARRVAVLRPGGHLIRCLGRLTRHRVDILHDLIAGDQASLAKADARTRTARPSIRAHGTPLRHDTARCTVYAYRTHQFVFDSNHFSAQHFLQRSLLPVHGFRLKSSDVILDRDSANCSRWCRTCVRAPVHAENTPAWFPIRSASAATARCRPSSSRSCPEPFLHTIHNTVSKVLP